MKRLIALTALLAVLGLGVGPAFAAVDPPKIPPKGQEGPGIRAKVPPKGVEGPDIRARVEPKGLEGPDVR
ncbi:MAG: hypothetical protein HYT85_05020 [candidate division NC10 bacterium]|nr:hypothetical protein [candidate division NC10 bacterium]MBI2457148.1 hypothetical protein [candidate division NC10 bacterium]MBI3086394.1 hypothetical protein [candidate division NC10 bacterium]